MAVPKRHKSTARRRMREAMWRRRLRIPNLVKCSNPACGQLIRAHRVCPYCGWYKGKQVLEAEAKGEVNV